MGNQGLLLSNQADKRCELLLKDFSNLIGRGIGCDWNRHDHDTTVQRPRRDAYVGPASFSIGHSPEVVDGQSGFIRDQFQMEDIAAFGEAVYIPLHMLHVVSEDRSPSRNQEGIRQLLIDSLWPEIRFDRASNRLPGHAY